MAEATVERPTPVWQKRLNWRWRRGDRVLVLKASFAADTDPEYSNGMVGDEAYKIPNNLTIFDGTGGEIRLTRNGAEQLRDALTEALEWDGQ